MIGVEVSCHILDTFHPTLLICPRVRMQPELLDNAPPGAIAVAHPSGWL